MGSPPSPTVRLPTNQAAAGDVRQGRRLAIAQRDINVLALSIDAAPYQSSHDAVACIQAGGQVGDGDADFNRRAISSAGDVHEAEFCLNHDIVPGSA